MARKFIYQCLVRSEGLKNPLKVPSTVGDYPAHFYNVVVEATKSDFRVIVASPLTSLGWYRIFPCVDADKMDFYVQQFNMNQLGVEYTLLQLLENVISKEKLSSLQFEEYK